MMKYIVMQHDDGTEVPIIFPNHPDFTHATLFDMVRRVKTPGANWKKCFINPVVSAGFIELESMKCYGRSESLNVDSRPEEDAELILTYNWRSY